MSGKVHFMLKTFFTKRTEGKEYLIASETIKLIMKGIDPALYTPETPDDLIIINRLRRIAREMSIQLD